ncbi:unnamed protein product, partial [Iphiclides podalirius]
MPSSDSEDFESADEGRNSPHKKERKKRLSSSNYSDNLESEVDHSSTQNATFSRSKNVGKSADGWDDFDIDELETESSKDVKETTSHLSKTELSTISSGSHTVKENISNKKETAEKSQDTGWNDFDDWGDSVITNNVKEDQFSKSQQSKNMQQQDPNIKNVTERLAAASTKSDAWGWGWGVDSILSTATAGITTLTNQVSQGISTVLETGIGAPDPEELARKSAKASENIQQRQENPSKESGNEKEPSKDSRSGSEGQFQFGSLISGVTKFVETTGTKVLAGGLDTLETIGKKTMEVLQDGDPGLAKKRAMLGLDPADKPVLSQVLREAKAKADEEDRIREQKREAKEVHYETLFDDFEGLVHLEALEMLSKQVSMRIEERIRSADISKRQDIKETLQQVAELCEMPEDEDEDIEEEQSDLSGAEALHERLLNSTRDIGLKMQYQPLVKHYEETLAWLKGEGVASGGGSRAVYKRAVSALARATAVSVEFYHKTAEQLLVKARRSTADEADALTQMTVVLTRHVSDLATHFTQRLHSITGEDQERINGYITNIFLEAENSSKYIQNAFQLTLPIIQIGAV